MFLTPHHFQQSDRYTENLISRRLAAIRSLGWGVCRLQINTDALANGEFVLSKCAAILPDGTALDTPDLDPLPPARPIDAAFDAIADVQSVATLHHFSFDRRPEDAHPRALLRRAGNDAVEQCPDAALEKERSGGFTDRPLHLLRVVFLLRAMRRQRHQLIAGVRDGIPRQRRFD